MLIFPSFAHSASIVKYANQIGKTDPCWINAQNALGVFDGLTADCTTTSRGLQDFWIHFPSFGIPANAIVDRVVINLFIKGNSEKRFS